MKKFYFLTLALICAFVANAAGDALYMVGYNNSWEPANPTEIPYDAEKGCYYLANVNFTNKELKISENKGTWDEFNAKAMCIDGDGAVQIGVTTKLWLYAETNIKIASTGTFDVCVDLTNKTITIGKPAEYKDVAIYAEKSGLLSDNAVLYYWGAVKNGPTWPGVEMTETTVNGKAYWTATISANGNFNIIFNDGNGNQTENIEGLSNETPAYYYVIKADKTFDTTTAIDEVAADNAAVEYYNLQGVKVVNPENGIFIKKQGNKVAKVVL